MRLRIVGSLGAVVIGAFSASVASGQSSQSTPDHFVASAGVGVGSSALTCEQCSGNRLSAPSGYVRVGRTFGSNLTLSGELNVWSKPVGWAVFNGTGDVLSEGQSGSRATIATLNAVAHWYTDESRHFFVDAGVGVGRYQAHGEVPGNPNLSAHAHGIGYQAGAGYDNLISRRFSLTPFATFFGITGAKFGDDEVEMGTNTIHVGLGLTWN